jgi:hypothetical protein
MATLPNDNIVVGYAPRSTLQKLVTLSQRSGPEAREDSFLRRVSQISSRSWRAIRSLGFALNRPTRACGCARRRS